MENSEYLCYFLQFQNFCLLCSFNSNCDLKMSEMAATWKINAVDKCISIDLTHEIIRQPCVLVYGKKE